MFGTFRGKKINWKLKEDTILVNTHIMKYDELFKPKAIAAIKRNWYKLAINKFRLAI